MGTEVTKMRDNLAENIKTFRKARGLTQEQLADTFNVTPGAVHKWESGMSTPVLPILLEMADYFDTSLDVLVGFEVRDNRTEVLTERLRKMAYEMDPDGVSEAEKALNKYPFNFAIVFECALIYGVHGINPRNDKYLKRSIELFEKSVTLISQNTDPGIDETVIYGQLAVLHQTMGNTEKALEIYKTHNASGVYDIKIGHILAQSGDCRKADECLSHALVKQIGDRMALVTGKLQCYLKAKNYEDAKALIEACLKENSYFKKANTPNILDKYDCVMLTKLAYIELKTGNKDEAKHCMSKAGKIAAKFDAAPDYDANSIRFVSLNEKLTMHDLLGKTCVDAIEGAIKELGSAELEKMWKSEQ